MTSIIFHLLLSLGMLWYQRKMDYRHHPLALAVGWYGISIILVFIESFVLTGTLWSNLLAQGLVISLFYIPAMYFTLRWADKHRKSLVASMLIFMAFALFSTLVAALVLARAPLVQGLDR